MTELEESINLLMSPQDSGFNIPEKLGRMPVRDILWVRERCKYVTEQINDYLQALSPLPERKSP